MTETPHRADAPVVVIGGGMAGLAAAWRLMSHDIPVTLLERNERVGGVLGTVDIGGHVFERGPTTVLSSAESLLQLIDEVGLTDRVVLSRHESHRRLIWRHGRLHEAPGGPGGLLTTSLMSMKGRLRLIAEPFIASGHSDEDESLRDFLTRRIGAEAVDALVDPFVSGVYAGDIDDLGADAFPQLVEFERSAGSIVKGAIARRKAAKAAAAADGRTRPPRRRGPAPLLTFPKGLGELPEAIRRRLGTRVRLDHDVFALEELEERAADGARWKVHAVADERQVHYDASAVVLAVPGHAAYSLLDRVDPQLGAPLSGLSHPHVAAIGLGFKRADVSHPLDAFGFLCGSDSPVPGDELVLGALFVSSVFPNRAPDGNVAISVMLGGSRDPEAAELADAELVERAQRTCASLLGARGTPEAVCVTRWPKAIPQYPAGHLRRIRGLRERLARHPGLHVAGNWLSGVGLEPTVATGLAAAAEILGD